MSVLEMGITSLTNALGISPKFSAWFSQQLMEKDRYLEDIPPILAHLTKTDEPVPA